MIEWKFRGDEFRENRSKEMNKRGNTKSKLKRPLLEVSMRNLWEDATMSRANCHKANFTIADLRKFAKFAII